MAAAWTRELIDCVAAVLASRESEHEHLLALNAGFEQARRSIAALRRKDCAWLKKPAGSDFWFVKHRTRISSCWESCTATTRTGEREEKQSKRAFCSLQKWAERRRRLLVICTANLRKQWSQELSETVPFLDRARSHFDMVLMLALIH